MIIGKVKKGMFEQGRQFEILGEPIQIGSMLWTPIRYLGEEDPSWIKSSAVSLVKAE